MNTTSYKSTYSKEDYSVPQRHRENSSLYHKASTRSKEYEDVKKENLIFKELDIPSPDSTMDKTSALQAKEKLKIFFNILEDLQSLERETQSQNTKTTISEIFSDNFQEGRYIELGRILGTAQEDDTILSEEEYKKAYDILKLFVQKAHKILLKSLPETRENVKKVIEDAFIDKKERESFKRNFFADIFLKANFSDINLKSDKQSKLKILQEKIYGVMKNVFSEQEGKNLGKIYYSDFSDEQSYEDNLEKFKNNQGSIIPIINTLSNEINHTFNMSKLSDEKKEKLNVVPPIETNKIAQLSFNEIDKMLELSRNNIKRIVELPLVHLQKILQASPENIVKIINVAIQKTHISTKDPIEDIKHNTTCDVKSEQQNMGENLRILISREMISPESFLQMMSIANDKISKIENTKNIYLEYLKQEIDKMSSPLRR